MQETIVLTYQKSTPGTHVFGTKEPGAAIKAIYIARTAFKTETPPQSVTLTIEAEEG